MTENNVPAADSVDLPSFPVMRPASVVDAGQVRLGGMGPTFPAIVADAGKVRLGGMGPLV